MWHRGAEGENPQRGAQRSDRPTHVGGTDGRTDRRTDDRTDGRMERLRRAHSTITQREALRRTERAAQQRFC